MPLIHLAPPFFSPPKLWGFFIFITAQPGQASLELVGTLLKKEKKRKKKRKKRRKWTKKLPLSMLLPSPCPALWFLEKLGWGGAQCGKGVEPPSPAPFHKKRIKENKKRPKQELMETGGLCSGGREGDSPVGMPGDTGRGLVSVGLQ